MVITIKYLKEPFNQQFFLIQIKFKHSKMQILSDKHNNLLEQDEFASSVVSIAKVIGWYQKTDRTLADIHFLIELNYRKHPVLGVVCLLDKYPEIKNYCIIEYWLCIIELFMKWKPLYNKNIIGNIIQKKAMNKRLQTTC